MAALKTMLTLLCWTLALLPSKLPAQDTLLIRQAQELVFGGELSACSDACAEAVAANPDSAIVHFLQGLCFSGQNAHEEAILAFGIAIRLEPYVPETHLERARSHFALGHIDPALRDLRQALKQDPGFVEALLLRAEIHMSENDLTAALEDLNLAKRLSPRDPEVYCLRAELFWTLGDLKSSLKEANYAVKLTPADPMPYITRANAHLISAAFQAALADADKAIELAPDAYALRNTRAFIHMDMDNLEAAHADLDHYLAHDSLAYDAHLTRALLYERIGDLQLALLTVLRADSMHPADPAVQEQLGFLYLRLGNDTLVAKLLEPLVASHPSRAFALSALGLAHARSGRLHDGLKELDRAIKIDDYDPRAYYHRALVYFMLEKPEKGCQDLDEAEAIGFADFYGPEELDAARKAHCAK